MKALITGAGGQLAAELARAAPAGWSVSALSRGALDIGDADAVARTVEALAPDLILNAAAYTAVDRAESEPRAAFRANRDGPAHLARAAVAAGSRLIHVSTDFVFDGGGGRAWRPDDATAPLGVYGASKLAGERAVAAAAPGALIVRTAWVYAAHGANFVRTMLRLMGERPEVRVVADQIGAPTSAPTLAAALWALASTDARGILHYTDSGVASWYDFAVAIAEEAGALGLIAGVPSVVPIATADWPTPARRPAFSVLDTTQTTRRLGRAGPHWRAALRVVLGEIAGAPP
ncbi:MAG: dTDP-4-dehydrorhamnose reductase [Caulobacteraceae bacterium]